MIHALLTKSIDKGHSGFQEPATRKMRSLAIVAFLLFASAGILCGQCNEYGFTITTTSLPSATVGVAYSAQIQTAGAEGQPAWTLNSGTLPPGLSLTSNSDGTIGIINGTPTTVGTYPFQVEAEYSYSAEYCATQNFSITVASAVIQCTPTVIPASPLPTGDVSVPYAPVHFQATGCPSSFTFSEQAVDPFNPNNEPPGLNLSTGGTFSGTPTEAGTFSFYITATDQNDNETQVQYSLTINPLPTIKTSSPLPNGPVGASYSQQITATGGTPPYVFSMNNNPPGITITPSGVLNGTPTTAGTYNFNIGVTDSVRGQTVAPFQVTFATVVTQVEVAPLSLTFNADLNGNPPPGQAIAIVPVSGATPPVKYTVLVNGGQSNTSAPTWLTVTPTSGPAPSGLVVSVDQGTLAAGSYTAGIQVLDSNGLATDVSVTLNVASSAQQLIVAPSMLNLSASSVTPGNLVADLAVSNSGASSVTFTTSVVGNSSWITGVTASSNTTTRNAPVLVQVQVNTNGLSLGAYQDAILISSPAGNVQIPVSLFVANSGPILAVDTRGVLFQALQGGGSTETQTYKIINLGDPGSTVNWSASLVNGSNWLNLVSSSGTATSNTLGNLVLSLTPNATQLTAAPYYALIEIADPNSLNSPQYVTAVLNLEPSTAAPVFELAPGGLLFTTSAGGTAPAPQQVQINASSSSSVTFYATAVTADGSSWLTVSPSSGPVSGQASASVAVSVDPTGLAAGIYSGDVNISIGGVLQSENVTFVVSPSSSSSARSHLRPEASGCVASKLAITETGLPNNFAVPAAWPATLIVQLSDDCGAPVTTANVMASFSNGDAALNLVSDSLGDYSATWQPGTVSPNLVVTINATSSTLASASAKLYGDIAANQTPPPTLAPGGTLNNLNPVVGGALAPGAIAQVFGSGLAASSVSTGVLPLPTTFDNTFALVGSTPAPLYFLSNGQINIQIPNEATATQQLSLILSVNNALTLPEMLNIVPAAPGILSADDGPTPPNVQNDAHLIAQRSDGSLVSSTNPAKPGDFLVMYAVGLGATDPSVASGAATPDSPLHNVTVQPTVTIGSQPATVAFAGLTPGFVGLYQINFQVPTSASSGDLEVDVTQNGVAANPTILPVSQ